MKKTITINIAGLVFNIEEDAYSILKEYLEKIGNKFSNKEERQEIIEDIEARIAELLSEKLNRNKEVINEIDVLHIEKVMGSPDNFEGDESEPKEHTESKTTSAAEKKKLYRDTDNKVIAGVCAGISNYFDWNIGIVRLLLALSVLVLGFGFWLYIIAWIIIPEAKSTSEKLAMKGKNATVDNIEKYLTKFKSDIKNFDTSNVSETVKNQSNKFNDFLVGTSRKVEESLQPKKRIGSFFHLISSFIGFILISIGIAIILGVVYSLIMPENVNQFKIFVHDLNIKLDLQTKDYLPIAISSFILALSIGLGLIILGMRFAFSRNKALINKLNPIGVIVRFSIILALISTIILSALNNKLHLSKCSFQLSNNFDYNTIVVKKLDMKSDAPKFKKVQLDIKKSDRKVATLKVESSGITKSFILNQSMSDLYSYKVTDSIIELSPYIYYGNGYYSDKNVEITLYVPDNDSVLIINKFDD